MNITGDDTGKQDLSEQVGKEASPASRSAWEEGSRGLQRKRREEKI